MALDPPELELCAAVRCLVWVLVTKLVSSRRAVHALNCRVPFPALIGGILKQYPVLTEVTEKSSYLSIAVTKASHKRKNFNLYHGSRGLEYMTIMTGNLVAGRQAWG